MNSRGAAADELGVGIFKTPDDKVAAPLVPLVVKLVNGITGVGTFITVPDNEAAVPLAPVVVKVYCVLA